MRTRWLLTLLAGGLCAFAHTAPAADVSTNFEAENSSIIESKQSVLVATVVYFFHDGTFDAFDVGAKASPGLAALAQGRGGRVLRDEFLAAHPDGLVSGVSHGTCNYALILEQYHAREETLDPVKHRYMSYLAYVAPSDDAFIGNDDPQAHEVFDKRGAFLGPLVVEITGTSVLDAGTMLNDETDIPAFDLLGGTDLGVRSDEVIREHPGFNGSARNPGGAPQHILGGTIRYSPCPYRVDPVLGDFTRPGFSLGRLRLTSGLSSYFSGAWYNPQLSGEGFIIDIFDAAAPKLSLSWYTYAPDDSGRQKWFYGVGLIDDIDATMELFETEGGRMGSLENPQRVIRKRWGTARVGFGNCWEGAVIVTPDDPALPRGTIPIRRVTAVPAGLERDCGAYTLDASDAAPPPF